jgi:hypothetical protein
LKQIDGAVEVQPSLVLGRSLSQRQATRRHQARRHHDTESNPHHAFTSGRDAFGLAADAPTLAH